MKIIPNITYKSVLQHITDIEKRNKAFHALDDQSKRLEIAWEALQIALMPQVRANQSGYWNASLHEIAKVSNTPEHFQKALLKPLPACSVCQRGLMMLAQIRIGNNVGTDCMYSRGSESIMQGFAFKSFKSMENAYERWAGKRESMYAIGVNYYPRSKQLLANICCNVLVNGDFKYRDTTDYLIIED